MKSIKYGLVLLAVCLGLTASASFATTNAISDTGFEDGTLSGWNKGSQVGTFSGSTISQDGSGVNIISGAVTFSAPSHSAVGNPTLQDGSPNPYHAPAVEPTTWTFAPFGTHASLLQPNNTQQFDSATSALGLSSSENQAIKSLLIQQQQASGLGNATPTDASWLTRTVSLTAGTTYTMSWNYIGTDYVPFNDGSITSLTYQGSGATPTITVNNGVGRYALLGFTNPGTGDYSTGTYGSTGWQISTYEVSVTGDYLLGFAVFNLGDTALSPVLLVDSQPGSTLKNGATFGAVVPNNPNAPVVTTAPATTTLPPTTTEPTTTTTTTTVAPTTTTEPTTTTSEPEQTLPPETTVVEPPTTVEQIIVELPETGAGTNKLVVYALLAIGLGMIFSWSYSERKSQAK